MFKESNFYTIPEEIVVEEFIKGYKYKDKVIRHSTVKVAN